MERKCLGFSIVQNYIEDMIHEDLPRVGMQYFRPRISASGSRQLHTIIFRLTFLTRQYGTVNTKVIKN